MDSREHRKVVPVLTMPMHKPNTRWNEKQIADVISQIDGVVKGCDGDRGVMGHNR